MNVRSANFSSRRGFTLIEAAMATAIIGIGVVSMLQLLAVGTVSNADSNALTTGLNLANNIREMAQGLKFVASPTTTWWGPGGTETLATYDDLDDLDGRTFSPPIDARRQQLTGFTNWSQTVKVESVDPNRLTLVVPHGTLTADKRPTSRLTVSVSHQGQVVCQLSWLVVYTQ